MTSAAAPLALKSLTIRKLPGLTGEVCLENLSPGVNVIFGPNGVGKSRTALAINLALWGNALGDARRTSLAAAIGVGEEPWAIDLDAGEARRQLRGVDATAPWLLGAESRDRYNVTLQDLLFDRGEHFARAISKESAGGYDLASAARELAIDRKPALRSGKETESLLRCVKSVNERRGHLLSLAKREEELERLRRDRDQARRSAEQLPRLKSALAFSDATADHLRAAAALAAFPPAMHRVNGKEIDQLSQLRADIALKSQALHRVRFDAARTKRAIADARFGDEDPPDEPAMGRLGGLLRELEELRSSDAAQDLEVRAAEARLASAVRALGPGVDASRVTQIDLRGIADLSALAQEAERSRAELCAIEAMRRWLGAAPDAKAPGDPQHYAQAIGLLTRWLAEPTTQPTENLAARNLMYGAAGAIALLALLLAWQWSIAAGALVLLAPALVSLWGRISHAGRPALDARPVYQKQFAQLNVDSPAAWTTADVEASLHALVQRWTAASLGQERAQRLADQQPRFEDAAAKNQEAAHRREQVAARLGLPPTTGEGLLHALVDALLRAQHAADDLAAARARMSALLDRRTQASAAITTTLARWGYTVSEPSHLAPAVEDLRSRREGHRSATQLLAQLSATEQEVEREAADLSARVDAFYSSLDLLPGDDAALGALLDGRPAFERAKTALSVTSARATEIEGALAGHRELLSLSREALSDMLDADQEQANLFASHSEQIATVSALVNQAKFTTDLEEAQANHREAAAVLARLRDSACETAAGWALVEHLRAASRERQQSAVFHRAAAIFARITRGHYQLSVDDRAQTPAFRCVDAERNIGLSLDELSSGTRVQLLLAVRVAFVEEQEQGPRLPLILDETLANSDEVRAREILDALIEIAASGRQIFYFTAQSDEVAKWRETLDARPPESATPHQFIDLAAVRKLAESQRTPARRGVTTPAPLVPLPGKMDRFAYGQLLQAPAIDPREPSVGAIHLWHLVDDMDRLHHLLAMGITSWGQWRTMAEHGGLGIVDGRPIYARAEALARLIESVTRMWRIGRGRRVDRQAIVESGIVSPKILPAVASLTANVDGDAAVLIDRLRSGAIRNFRTATTERLKGWLSERGYLSARPPLDREEIRLRAIAQFETDLQARQITLGDVEDALTACFSAEAERSHRASPVSFAESA